jgi:hypothetical protein
MSHSRALAAVVINEIFPKTNDVTQEWIELYNTGTETVSLDRWKIENNFGDQRSFTLNASVTIAGQSFLTLSQSQYGFTLNKEGDTVRLFDSSNSQVDNQNYQGILGYNVSVGRSTDGAGSWTICTVPTQNQPNKCPPPTPTPTALPTPIPSNTPIPLPTQTPTLPNTPTLIPSIPPIPTGTVLAAVNETIPSSTPSSSDNIQFNIPKLGAMAVVGIGSVWAVVTIIILWTKKRQSHKE